MFDLKEMRDDLMDEELTVEELKNDLMVIGSGAAMMLLPLLVLVPLVLVVHRCCCHSMTFDVFDNQSSSSAARQRLCDIEKQREERASHSMISCTVVAAKRTIVHKNNKLLDGRKQRRFVVF